MESKGMEAKQDEKVSRLDNNLMDFKIKDTGIGQAHNFSSKYDCDCKEPVGTCNFIKKCKLRSSDLADEKKDSKDKPKTDLLDRYFDAMGNSGSLSGNDDKTSAIKTEVSAMPTSNLLKSEPEVSNSLIEDQWQKVKTNINNLKDDAGESLPHIAKQNALDQYFTEVDQPKIDTFAKTEPGKKHQKYKRHWYLSMKWKKKLMT